MKEKVFFIHEPPYICFSNNLSSLYLAGDFYEIEAELKLD